MNKITKWIAYRTIKDYAMLPYSEARHKAMPHALVFKANSTTAATQFVERWFEDQQPTLNTSNAAYADWYASRLNAQASPTGKRVVDTERGDWHQLEDEWQYWGEVQDEQDAAIDWAYKGGW